MFKGVNLHPSHDLMIVILNLSLICPNTRNCRGCMAINMIYLFLLYG